MDYTVVEMWTPNAAFLALSTSQREEFFATLGAGMGALAEIGVTSAGWGRTERADQSASYQWFAIWTAPTREAVDAFLAGVMESGWYLYFDQEVLVSPLLPIDQAITAMVAA